MRDKYGPSVSPLLHLYTLTHFLLSFLCIDSLLASIKVSTVLTQHIQHHASIQAQLVSQASSVILILYQLWGLTSIGLLYERSWLAWVSEMARCWVSLVLLHTIPVPGILPAQVVQLVFSGQDISVTRDAISLFSVSSVVALVLLCYQFATFKTIKNE